jgi:hypothetical protein
MLFVAKSSDRAFRKDSLSLLRAPLGLPAGIAALARFPLTLFFACFIKANAIDDCHSMFSIAFEATAYSLRCRHDLALVWPLGSSPALGNEANSDVIGGPHAVAVA